MALAPGVSDMPFLSLGAGERQPGVASLCPEGALCCLLALGASQEGWLRGGLPAFAACHRTPSLGRGLLRVVLGGSRGLTLPAGAASLQLGAMLVCSSKAQQEAGPDAERSSCVWGGGRNWPQLRPVLAFPPVLTDGTPPPQVHQGNMPGLQNTFLAMDTEEGVEVVWNELDFADLKAFKAHEVRVLPHPPSPVGAGRGLSLLAGPPPHTRCLLRPLPPQEKIKTIFEQLVVVDHPNIVKVHKYWLVVKDCRAQVRERERDPPPRLLLCTDGASWVGREGSCRIEKGPPCPAPPHQWSGRAVAGRSGTSGLFTAVPSGLEMPPPLGQAERWGGGSRCLCCWERESGGQVGRGSAARQEPTWRRELGLDWAVPGPDCLFLPLPKVVFITEYVSSGSLKQFLKKTKKNHKAMNVRVGTAASLLPCGAPRGGWEWGRAQPSDPGPPCRAEGRPCSRPGGGR